MLPFVASETSIIGKDGNGRQYFGYDFGMTVNPSVMLRLEETKDSKLVVRSYKFMKEKRFANQKRLANMMMDKCHRGSMDAGAQGSQLAQELEEEYGDKFEGVMLTGSTMRAELANLVWRFFDEGRIVIPDNDDIIEHLFAIKKEEREGRANMPGHVRAGMNWNTMKKMNSDNYSQQSIDGMKTIVCKLKPNPLNWTSIGYPTDEMHLPQWFKDLPFDDALMEATVVDQKIDNLLHVLEWDLASETNTTNTFNTLFEFD